MDLITIWFIIGIMSGSTAVAVFRKNGKSDKKGELYLAVLSPLLGPITFFLIAIDLFKTIYRQETNNE